MTSLNVVGEFGTAVFGSARPRLTVGPPLLTEHPFQSTLLFENRALHAVSLCLGGDRTPEVVVAEATPVSPLLALLAV